jgi:preprotein translocase subunit SecA
MLGGILKKILGDKSATDQKKYQPVIQQVNDIYASVQTDSDDALRGRTAKFKQRVQDAIAGLEAEIADLTKKANDINMPLHQKEAIYESIDSKEKEVNVIIEKVLEEILPEAFAVVKETAKRWATNGQLTVTATELDKELATKKDGITIEGDKAIWSNKWTAAGAAVEWVMVHYDVQLMGCKRVKVKP